MIEILLWCLTACTCGLMVGSTYNAILALTDWTMHRLEAWRSLKQLEGEVHMKALRAASREVE